MYKGKFASELSISDVKEYYDELRQKCPRTEEQWADFNILQEKLTAFAYRILDGSKTNGDMIKSMFPYGTYGTNGNEIHVFGVGGNGVLVFTIEWWNAPYKGGTE